MELFDEDDIEVCNEIEESREREDGTVDPWPNLEPIDFATYVDEKTDDRLEVADVACQVISFQIHLGDGGHLSVHSENAAKGLLLMLQGKTVFDGEDQNLNEIYGGLWETDESGPKTLPHSLNTTYKPDVQVKYVISQHDIEDWLEEQYDVPHFNVASDLQEDASPDGSYSVRVDREISDYERGKLEDFFNQVEKQDGTMYVAPDTYHLTDTLLNKLALDDHIPIGHYEINFSF